MTQATQSIPLIDGLDNWEIVRDKIGEILATEDAAQVVLATAAGRDETLWEFDTYIERSNPWEAFRDGGNTTPIVNIWTDRSKVDEGTSTKSISQWHNTTFNVDVYGYAVSEETAGGHDPGDKAAALVAHRIVRLVRNILMHDKHTYLLLRYTGLSGSGCVKSRWVSDFEFFQPVDSAGRPIQHVHGARLHVDVEHFETIDFPEYETLEIINVELTRGSDGKIWATLEYDSSP